MRTNQKIDYNLWIAGQAAAVNKFTTFYWPRWFFKHMVVTEFEKLEGFPG
jgi:hypothetical protein